MPWLHRRNLIVLRGMREEDIHSEAARRLRRLLLAGVSEQLVHDTVELLRHMPCSTAIVEEAHASGSLVKRHHPAYNERSLSSRAHLHSLRALARGTLSAAPVKKIERALERNERKRPRRARAWQMGFKRAANATCGRGEQWRQHDVAETRRLIGEHSRAWKNRELHEKLEMRIQLREHILQQERHQRHEHRRLMAERARLLEVEESKRPLTGPPNHVKSACFSEEDLDKFAEHFNSEEIQSIHVLPETTDLPDPPRPPPRSKRELLTSMESTWPSEPQPAPPWFNSLVAQRRDLCTSTAFGTSIDGDRFWFFLFAKQNPVETTWLEMRRIEQCLRMDSESFDPVEDSLC